MDCRRDALSNARFQRGRHATHRTRYDNHHQSVGSRRAGQRGTRRPAATCVRDNEPARPDAHCRCCSPARSGDRSGIPGSATCGCAGGPAGAIASYAWARRQLQRAESGPAVCNRRIIGYHWRVDCYRRRRAGRPYAGKQYRQSRQVCHRGSRADGGCCGNRHDWPRRTCERCNAAEIRCRCEAGACSIATGGRRPSSATANSTCAAPGSGRAQ